jgi:hypothetical protein
MLFGMLSVFSEFERAMIRDLLCHENTYKEVNASHTADHIETDPTATAVAIDPRSSRGLATPPVHGGIRNGVSGQQHRVASMCPLASRPAGQRGDFLSNQRTPYSQASAAN